MQSLVARAFLARPHAAAIAPHGPLQRRAAAALARKGSLGGGIGSEEWQRRPGLVGFSHRGGRVSRRSQLTRFGSGVFSLFLRVIREASSTSSTAEIYLCLTSRFAPRDNVETRWDGSRIL
jgi:hypothetical protein